MANLIDIIKFYFSKPKYKLHMKVKSPYIYKLRIIKRIKRDWKFCVWSYDLCGMNISLSEGVIDFYNKEE